MNMLHGLQIDALAEGCADCGKPFEDAHRIRAAYAAKDIRSFERQVELGIIGANVRNFWVHVDCTDLKLTDEHWNMNPDIHHCIKCGKSLESDAIIVPVFQVIDPKAVNPDDPTDTGVALGERVYFIHADCKNTKLNKRNTNILFTG